MIKKYNEYINESLLNSLEGPSEEEFLNIIKNMKPQDMLHKSIESDYLNGIEEAFKNGADIHIQNESPLRSACEDGSYKAVKFLLEHDADVNIYDEEPLRNAVYNNHIEIVKLLLNYDANVNSYGGQLAINRAIKTNNIKILTILVDKLNPNKDILDFIKYNNANELLMMSIRIDFTRGIKKAIDDGADLKKDNYVSIKFAVMNDNYISVKYILDNYKVELKNDGHLKLYSQHASDKMKKLLDDRLKK